jgi:hypothetical protein
MMTDTDGIARDLYLTGNQGLGFEDSFRIEHDDVFDNFLGGGIDGTG